ncbi:hypothetical protein B0H17DRAFT_1143060 [Mycena rosella]|uniref:Transcription elongation factor Eaf N-terminal domain-containing protein n=1 Tax=Mycena rosella TaxID=1033263 RepID=A0AAD7CWA1_MYCRO|nr:hypothetical protein B0H17DRAFT_1143060 [Mycena rosella]
MASSSSSTWVPQGRHEVQIGPSLNKALKARKGGPPPSIEVTRGKDATSVVLEHPSLQPGENHRYNGTETPAKELDCVLIYDEETGSYKLEKLESYIILSYDGKATVSLPTSAAPTPTQTDTGFDDTLVDAAGESDDEMPSHFAPPRQEAEESEEELEPALPPSKPPAAAAAPRPTKAAPQRKSTKKAPPPPPIPADLEEETLQFGRPATKRAKPTPAVALSLPGASASSWVAPPAPIASTSAPPAHRAASPIAVQSDSDEDDWEPVPVDAEAPQEIDMDDFEQTLEAEMEAEMEMAEEEDGSEPEDFLAEALPQAPESAATPVRPMSMGQLAGYSDDEYSSSEDSDDD